MSNPTNSPSENVKKLEARVEQAAKVMKVDPKLVWEKLDAYGISHDDDGYALLNAETTCEGDARAVFCESGDTTSRVPVARFKAGWQVLKGKVESKGSVKAESGLEALIESMRTPAQMKDEDLLDRYGPESSTEVLDELKRRSHDRGFIVFDETKGENAINIVASLALLRIARRQETPSTYKLGEKLVRVYRLGEFPMLWAEECPINPEVILADNYCEKCMESWEGISHDDRVIVRVARDMGAIDVSSLAKIHELVTKLKSEGAAFILAIPAVTLRYEELKADNKLPILRRKFSAGRYGKADPFFQKM